LRELGNDPLYAALCKRQQCFRARLGPKPWRAQLPMPPGSFPARRCREAEFAIWPAAIRTGLGAVRRLPLRGGAGRGRVAGPLRPLVAAHDEACGALSERPLA
jgi:hypothetical protein